MDVKNINQNKSSPRQDEREDVDFDADFDAVFDDHAAAQSSRLTAAALHLMSAYAQCACPKLAVIVEAHIAELARVTPDACVRAVCEALHKNWSKEVALCAAKGCFAENVIASGGAQPSLMQKIRHIKFH